MTSGDKPHESPTTPAPAEPEGSAHVETPDEVQEEGKIAKIEGAMSKRTSQRTG